MGRAGAGIGGEVVVCDEGLGCSDSVGRWVMVANSTAGLTSLDTTTLHEICTTLRAACVPPVPCEQTPASHPVPLPLLSPFRSESLAKKRALRMASQASKEAGAPAS